MRATISLSQISDPVKLSLLKRALADRRHIDRRIRDEAVKFMARITDPALFELRHSEEQHD